jgi:alkylation response protein AidB-like acyl-CoA dehydrogenase
MEHQQFRERLHDFLKRLGPKFEKVENEEDWEAQKECLHALGDKGHLRHLFPPDEGAPNLQLQAIVAEELAYANYATETTLASSLSSAMTLRRFASDELQETLMPGLLTGRELCAVCITEPNAGSDTSEISTSIVSDGNQWVVTGFKRYISNASVADYYLVYGVTAPKEPPRGRLSVVLVPKGTPGLSVPRTYRFMGRRGSDVGEVNFDECRVPKGNLIGELNGGYKMMLQILNFQRILLGATGLGVARSAFDLAVDHAQSRKAFGQHLGCKQLIWERIAEMSWRLESTRLMTKQAMEKYTSGIRGKELSKYSSMAKLVGSKTALFCADAAVQILGGDGLTKEFGRAEQIYRDARALPIVGGTSEFVKYQIASREMPGLKLNL